LGYGIGEAKIKQKRVTPRWAIGRPREVEVLLGQESLAGEVRL